MSLICPTVTPTTVDPHEYRAQLERIMGISKRIQLDFMDGEFASPQSTPIDQAWLPDGVSADIHLMFQRPQDSMAQLIKLNPTLVIIHAEADVDHMEFFSMLRGHGIKGGLALLPDTTVESVADLIPVVDHVLLFAGSLGTFGGVADLSQLDKVASIREHLATVEIGWDGGANSENVAQLAAGGIDVINVGSAIQRTEDPQRSYLLLSSLIS